MKYCNTDPGINRTLACYARLGEREHKNLDNYRAIGTASKITQQNFLQHYQPQDTQRDVIWVDATDNEKQLACVGGTTSSSKPAGLQIKVSNDGLSYVLPHITNYFYPILYIDLSDDWHRVQSTLKNRGIGATLIHADQISLELKPTLKNYFSLILQLINQAITVKNIIDMSKYYDHSTLLAGMAASSTNANRTIILSK